MRLNSRPGHGAPAPVTPEAQHRRSRRCRARSNSMQGKLFQGVSTRAMFSPSPPAPAAPGWPGRRNPYMR